VNLYQNLIAQMDRSQRVRFINTLRESMAKRLNVKTVSDVDLLANLEQDEYDAALDKSGLPLFRHQDENLLIL